ncbi:MAG TPA: agmatine deiminase family protein [Terriglobales bacterium]|nr:agmatine deiminase family protein [Terriglobales bacterium]
MMRSRKPTLPGAAGYRMPAEWEPHESTWLAWPHFRDDWPGKFEPIQWVYAEIIRNLARHERVDLVVNSTESERRARGVLEIANALSDNVVLHQWRTDRVWTRDSGCIFLKPEETQENSGLLALNFQFNAWAKYPNYKNDAKLGAHMAKSAGAKIIQPFSGEHRVVLEGGSIDVNGHGTLLSTEECLLSKIQERNPPMDRTAYEQMFADYFSVQSVIWLGDGVAGDDTHGHVDDITRFVARDRVVTMIEHNDRDENFATLRANLGRLKAARTADGRKLEIVELPMPRPVIFEGRRLPASYANFYIANGAVLVPVFNDPNDRVALNTLAELFPASEIIPIYSGDLIWGFGALHCMTQQQPRF